MKNLKEMTGIEVIEALIESIPLCAIEDIVAVINKNDLQILSNKARCRIMESFSEDAHFFNHHGRAVYKNEHIEKFFTFIGVDFSLPINEAEVIEKSMKIGNGDSVRNIFKNVISADPAILKDLTKEAKEEMLKHLYIEGRSQAEKEVLKKDTSRNPEYIAGLKALLE